MGAEGQIVFKDAIAGEEQRELTGFAGCLLRVEGKADVASPLANHLFDAVDSLNGAGGTGFLILERAEGTFVQVAGGNGRYTAEWRDASGHWVAGHPASASGPNVAIATNGCVVVVQSKEVLSADDAKTAVTHFAKGLVRPTEYAWRKRRAGLQL